MTRAMMLVRFLRDQAWWRLDCPGVNAIRAARSVVALLDTAICLEGLPDNHPDLEKLARAGCFRDGVFDPGEAGLAVVRGWKLADQPTVPIVPSVPIVPHQDLLATLAFTVGSQVHASAQVPVVPPEGVRHEAAPRNGVSFPSDPPVRPITRGPLLVRPPTRRVPPLAGATAPCARAAARRVRERVSGPG